jgi:hypothetical protein
VNVGFTPSTVVGRKSTPIALAIPPVSVLGTPEAETLVTCAAVSRFVSTRTAMVGVTPDAATATVMVALSPLRAPPAPATCLTGRRCQAAARTMG